MIADNILKPICFDDQVEILVHRGFASYADADSVRGRAPKTGSFLFVPPPPEKLRTAEWMEKLKIEGKSGMSHLKDVCLREIEEFPTTSSILCDISNGCDRLCTKPFNACLDIRYEQRTPYGIWRGIIHVALYGYAKQQIAPRVYYGLQLVGSTYGKDNTPVLQVFYGKPALAAYGNKKISSIDGAPSARRVILP